VGELNAARLIVFSSVLSAYIDVVRIRLEWSTITAPAFTSTAPTGAWEDHAYSYSPTCDQAITTWGLTTNASWLSQNATTGVISGTPDNTNSTQSYYVDLTATNANGVAWQNYTVTVANNIPTITTTPGTSVWMTKKFYYNVSATDWGAYGGTFGASITTNWTGAYNWTDATGEFNFSASVKGSFWFNISFDDNSGAGNASISQNFTVTVAEPYFTSSPILIAWEDHAYSYTPTVNTTVTSWGHTTNGSAWIAQNSGTGEIYGTPDNTYSEQSYWINISASTLYDGTIYQNYSIFVHNYAPQFTSTPPTTGTVHVNITYNANTDDEGVGVPGGNYSGVSTNFTDPYTFNLTTGVLTITVLHSGSFWFNITADDQTGAGNATSWQNFTVTVGVPSDWSFTSSPVTGAWEDHGYVYTPITDTGLISNWSLTTNATWLSLNSTTGEVYGFPSNLYAGQSFSVSLMGWDTNYTHWQNYSIFVANQAPTFLTTPLATIWIGIIYGYDPTTDDEGLGGHYILIWDSRLTVLFNATTGLLIFNPQMVGVFLFSLTFDDGSGALNATVLQAWSVAVQGPGGGGSAIDVDFTWTVDGNNVSFTVVSTFTSPTVQYLWDFGDGSTSTLMNPTHSYAAVGTYSVTLLMGSQYATVGSVEHSVVIQKMSHKGSIFTVLDVTGQVFVLMMFIIGLALAVATKHPLAIIVAIVFLMLTVIFIVVPFLSSFGFGPLI
jgi:hypothetical protein